MSSRERNLAIAVSAVLALIVGYIAWTYVGGQFGQKNGEITKLESEIAKSKKAVFASQLAAKKISEYEARSLPSDPEIARNHYHNWLLSEVQKAGFALPDVAHNGSITEKGFGDKGQNGLFLRHNFTVSAKGTLPQVVDWMHAFYGVDWLHKITFLKLKPLKDSKQLDVTIKVEALSLTKAKDTETLVLKPSKRLQLADRQAYHDTIVNRNLFGPPNNPPKMAVSGSPTLLFGRPADLSLKGSDPDPLDKVVRYVLIRKPDDTVKFDEEKGRLTWLPKQPGKYEFVFQAFDDGYPSLGSKEEKFVLNVTEPPKTVKKPPDFDHARFTVLTAVLDLDGKGEIWLHVRPLGETVKLHRGDHFEIGSIEGTIADIGQYDFSFTCAGKLLKLAKGDILERAKIIGDAPVATAAQTAPAPEASEAGKSVPASNPAEAATPVNAEDRAS